MTEERGKGTPLSAKRPLPWELEFEALQRKIDRVGPAEAPSQGRPVLIWTMTGGSMAHLEIGAFTALALGRRGIPSLNVVCDGTLSGCILHTVTDGRTLSEWAGICGNCRHISQTCLERAGLPYCWLGELLSPSDVRRAREQAAEAGLPGLLDRRAEGVRAGLHALASLARYYRSPASRLCAPGADAVAREFFFASLVNAQAARKALERYAPRGFYSSHGVFADWGPSYELALRSGIPCARYKQTALRGRFMVRRDTPEDCRDANFLTAGEWAAVRDRGITSSEEAALDELLEEYASGRTVEAQIFSRGKSEERNLRQELGLDGSRPAWGVFLHNFWDFHLLAGRTVYPDIMEWVADTLRIISEVPDVQWLIKTHPVGVAFKSRFDFAELLAELDAPLPPHVILVPSERRINNFALQELLSGCVTIRGSAGLEMALQGKPAILAGEAHYGGKGFTLDARDREHYRELLRRAARIPLLRPEQRRLARVYGHDFFLRRPVDLSAWRGAESGWPRGLAALCDSPGSRFDALADRIVGPDPAHNTRNIPMEG